MEVREFEEVVVKFDSGDDDVRPGIDPIESTQVSKPYSGIENAEIRPE